MLGMVRISKEANAVGVEGPRRKRAGSKGTQHVQATVQNLDFVLRIPHALQESHCCVSGWESASPLLSLFPTNRKPARAGVKDLVLSPQMWNLPQYLASSFSLVSPSPRCHSAWGSKCSWVDHRYPSHHTSRWVECNLRAQLPTLA